MRRRGLPRPARVAELRRRVRRPPAHWALLGFCLAALVLLLAVQGIAAHTTGRSGTPSSHSVTPLEGKPPLLAMSGSRLVGAEQPVGKRIALTFDDGPSPRWTPQIEAVLRRNHVPGTFFVVGSAVVNHPGIVRDLSAHGFEIGNHTFSHVDLSRVPGWERSLQLGMTENAVAGAADLRPRLMRPPYSAGPSAVNDRQLPAIDDVARRGYVIALSDYDSRDWARPGVADIVRNATPPGERGGIVLMHDGGGNRSETVAALERLIPALRKRGFTFVGVSALTGVAPRALSPPPSGWERSRGKLLLGTLAVARWITGALTFLLAPIALLAVLRMIILVLLARRHARVTRARPGDPEFAPAVSIVVPAYNEAVGIARCVSSLAASDYPDFEIVVVDDGSEDATAEIVNSLELDCVRVISQPNRGKPSALNTGIAASSNDVLPTVDADTVFEPDTLRYLIQPFRDPEVGAVAGNTKVGNRSGLLGRWQHIEYVMGFNLDRRLYDMLRCMPTVPGAVGGFRREGLVDIGGVSSATLAEDTDITLGIGRAGWRVAYAEDARAWTEAPPSLGALWRQRYRWSFGTMQAVWKHRAAAWRPGERRIGWIGIPYLVLFQIALPLLAPLIDVFALYGIAFLDPVPVMGYWVAFNVLNLAVALYAFRLHRAAPAPVSGAAIQ